MIQLKLILYGITLVGAVALAVYHHYNNAEAQQQQQYKANPPQRRRRRSPSPSPVRSWSQDVYSLEPSSLPNCPICYCTIDRIINRRFLPCAHEFHDSCIQQWLKLGNTCPICRYPVP